jgi:hypothetical protein
MLHFQPCHGKTPGKFGERDGNIDEIFKPGYRDKHILSSDILEKGQIFLQVISHLSN